MFDNLISGWRTGAAVRRLVFRDKKLLFYPLVSGIILLAFTVLVFATMFSISAHLSSLEFIIGLFLFYMASYIVSVYILVAMLLAFKSFAAGRPMGMSHALAEASGYAVVILEWAVFEATVVMALRAIEQRLGSVGGTMFGIVASMALSLATMFSVQVIVDKRTGPLDTIKESSSFIMENFGQSFGGIIYSDLYSLIFIAAGIVAILAALFMAANPGAVPVAAFIAIGIIGLAVLAFGFMLGYVLSNVYRMVIYDSINGGSVPSGLSKEMIEASIRETGSAGSRPRGLAL